MGYVIHRERDALVLELFGRTWGDLAGLQLKDEVSAALALGRRRFVLDLSRVDFLTSMGVGIVVAAWSSIRHAEGSLIVCGVRPRVQAVLDVSGLTSSSTSSRTGRRRWDHRRERPSPRQQDEPGLAAGLAVPEMAP